MALNVHRGSVGAQTLQQLLVAVISQEDGARSASRPSICQDFCRKFRRCARFQSGGTPPIEGFCDRFEEAPNAMQELDKKALAACQDSIAKARGQK